MKRILLHVIPTDFPTAYRELLSRSTVYDSSCHSNAQVLYSDNFADGFAAEDRVVSGDILISAIKSNM